MKTSKVVVSLIGPPGSGKGTQTGFLCDRFGWISMSSGDLLRERMVKKDYTGRKIQKEVTRGVLVPILVVAHLWFDRMEEIKRMDDFPGLVIDGSPRRIMEASLIKGGLSWYGWGDDYRIVYLRISKEESMKRLLAENQGRARSDDIEKVIETRWGWFIDEVEPMIEDIRSRGELIEVNGEQSREEVFSDILKALGLHGSD